MPTDWNTDDIGRKARLERVAHRGAPRERLENTLPSFFLALERGADAIELDVHATDDGEVVVHHDYEVQNRRIASSSWIDLKDLDLGGGSTIPRLADVLDALADRAMAYVELKGVHIEAAVARVLANHGRRTALHSFDHAAIQRVRQIAPEIPRGVLLDRGTPRAADLLGPIVHSTGPRDVWPHWTLVDAAFMRTARHLGVRVIQWTVNSAESARDLAAFGVDGICSDDVRLLANL